ncbi:MAG TPA: phosphoribosyltransferase family protein, partial [Thermoanaerobaculia bacterium]|nr:phosphoribosyltransferase family protein [Thermoanaerobaculia bacterium]
MRHESEHIEPLFEAAALRGSVAELAKRLAADFGEGKEGGEGDAEPLLLAILGGSLIFLADLVRAIDQPVRYELMQVGYSEGPEAGPATHPAETEAAEKIQNIHYPIPVEIAGRRVVVLKDVVASGVIEVYLGDKLRQHGAREVRFAALIDMPDERKTDFTVDYGAFTTRRDGILVGYGLKHEGRYGNLPYIGRL